MKFLSLGWLSLLAVIPPLIVLMYLLRLRRQRVVISSILLWRKSLEDLQANAPFQKLRNNLLLWLQLLAAIIGIFALTRPMMKLTELKGAKSVVLVDCSASMGVREVMGTRIELAREALTTMIDDMTRGDEMMIVAFDHEARVIQTFTNDKARLRAAAETIEPRDSLSSSRSAMALARSAAESRTNVEVVVFSDGKIQDLDRSPAGMPPIKFVPIGETAENVGIVQLDLRETFAEEAKTQLFVTVENYGKTQVDQILECYIDNKHVDSKEVSLEPGQRAPIIFSDLQTQGGEVELRLTEDDSFMADNVVYGLLPEQRDTKILLVTDDNIWLEKYLSSAPDLEVYKVAPDKYESSATYDLTIFDCFAPKNLDPGAYMFFNALPPIEDFAAGAERLKMPAVIDWSRVHPLTRYVNFELLTIGDAIDVNAPSYIHTLAEGEIGPLVFAFEQEQIQAVVVAFDLKNSDWYVRVSYPVFMANSIRWLTRMAFSGQAFSYASGAAYPVAPGAGITEARITSPSGDERVIDLTQGRVMYFANTDEVGFYRMKRQEQDLAFAVNLLSPEESNIEPVAKLKLRDRDVVGDPDLVRSNREIWLYLAIALLAVLSFEWFVYCRRTFI